MATYNELFPANYYLIQENENAKVELVYIPMVTSKCVLVEYEDEEQTMTWFKKTDQLYEVIEQLTEEQAVIYESLFEDEDEDDPWNESGEDDEWFDFDEEDDDDDDGKIRALKN